MKNHVSMGEILDIIRRRKMYFLIPFLFIAIISVVGAFVLPKRYESYTTVLVQKNPMEDKIFDLTRGFGEQNQLDGFNEILVSRTTVRALLDSLGSAPADNAAEGWDVLIDATRRRITTDLRGNESFRISFADSDPFMAQRAASALCNLYIETSLRADKQEAEGKVKYLKEAVATLEQEVQEKQKEFLGGERNRVATAPSDIASLELNYNKLETDARDLNLKLQEQERTLKQIADFQSNLDDPAVVARIAALDAEGTINYSDTLKSHSLRYNQLLTRYKPTYPQVQIARRQLADLLRKFGDALEADVQTNRDRRAGLVSERERTRSEIGQNVTQNTWKGARTAEYMQAFDNLAETKRKLVMARQAQELVDRGASRYVILDPAQVPTTPTKPKKGLIIGGGGALGLVIGLVTMFMMEYYDPTIRRKQDIEVFNKPIIGYLP